MYGCFYLNRANIAPLIPLIHADLNISYTRIGLMTSLFYLMYTAGQMPFGWLGDRYGPRRIITIGGIGSAMSCVFLFFSGSPAILYVILAVNGVMQSSGWGPSVKLLGNWFSGSRFGLVLGTFTTSISLFTVIAYFLSGYLGETYGWRTAIVVPAMILLLCSLAFWLIVRDTPQVQSIGESRETVKKNSLHGDFRTLIGSRQMWIAFLSFSCLMYIQYGVTIWLPTYLQGKYGINIVQASAIASLYFFVGLLARPSGGYISDRFFAGRRNPIILVGMFLMDLFLLGLSVSGDIGSSVIFITLSGFCFQLFSFLFFTIPGRVLPDNLVSTGSSFLDTGGHLGSLCAMLTLGWLIDFTGSFQSIIIALLFAGLLGLFAVCFLKESHNCQKSQ
jgi:sugar phosphate permease